MVGIMTQIPTILNDRKMTPKENMVLMVCITSIILLLGFMWFNMHPYEIKFIMDNNTVEAIKSINWSMMY